MLKTQRNIGYDIIRIIAIFFVVANHSNATTLPIVQGTMNWYIVLVFQIVCVVAVPLFFMVSGALLLDKEKAVSVGELYKSRIPKQAIPFIVWSTIYVLARMAIGKIPFTLETFTSLIHTPAYYQFWFMYTLLAIYMLLPILQTLISNSDKKKTEYILILWVVFSVVIPVASRFIPGFKISEHVDLVLCEGYVGYFILGHYLSKYKKDVKSSTSLLLWFFGTIATIICAIGEYIYSTKTGDPYHGYFYQATVVPGIVIATVGIFLFFGNREYKLKEKSINLIQRLSAHSIGIYYIHMLVLTALNYIFPAQINILFVIGEVATVYVVSLLITEIISLIPGVRRILIGEK